MRIAYALLALTLAPLAAAQGKNLLFYGNSFTYYVWGYGVPEVVAQLAVAAGHPAPFLRTSYSGGGILPDYATQPFHTDAITTSLPPGATWDHVVMQGHMMEATGEQGYDPADFRSAALQILANVRAHSPAAGAVMFQTWACAWGQFYYPVPWPTPLQMHDEVRGNYRLAMADFDLAHGVGAARLAAVGDAVALLGWDPVWYEPDLFHPNPAMVLLAAMCIYTSIYEEPVCTIEPSFQPPDALATLLQSQGVGEAEWRVLTGIADRCAAPQNRRYPGSGDHLLLESSTDGGVPTACADKPLTLGSLLQLRMRSLNGRFDAAPCLIVFDPFVTGLPTGPSTQWPEVASPTGGAMLLLSAADLTAPLGLTLPMPLTLPGISVRVQGIALQASAETGNPLLTATDAHELIFW
ncbi:MAG: hypothetical protein R3F29_00170 [Planctomycetota bacterium]